jgi:aminopeptidase YwaD
MKKFTYISLVLGITINFYSYGQSDPKVTVKELKDHVYFLAGDKLKGRYPGTAEDSLLFSYISGVFKSSGLDLYNQSGIQKFDFVSNSKQGPGNSITVDGKITASPAEFMPFCFSTNGSLSAGIVFAGYGYEFKNDTVSRNDYKGIDIKGKWVMVLRGNPVSNEKKNAFTTFEKDRSKAMLAKDKGAAGIIFVSGLKYDQNDELNAMSGNLSEVGIPCFQIKRTLADEMLAKTGTSIKDLEERTFQKPDINSFALKTELNATTDVEVEKTVTGNVIAVLKGSNPAKADEYIVIGAHHDHLGMGGQGSSSRMPDTVAIHYGADDNASGVAAVLELAGKLSSLKPERSIVFVTFGAEEKGILGSNYFTSHPPVPLDKIELMLNLDMVGRLRDSLLQVGGAGTSPGFKTYIQSSEKNSPFIFSISDPGYGPSDHAAFYSKDKPVLFFTTGAHQDYHTPFDRADSINYAGLAEITEYVAEVAMYYADLDSAISFREAGPKESSSGRYKGKVTFGIMPDVTGEGKDGMKVLAVTEGKPASNAGMKKGDIITGIDGKPVGNIQDYMYRLEQLKPGYRAVVSVTRNGNKLELLIQL